ncbi:hypothetical protein SEPCBS119000_006321 [Sporothrix epigloea]|uniref:HNH nuclease domain-containing protein n=1 Tax=Sporothrix epigloea TaxID=1892477 RepID=A0ABP0E6H7_9PEZI
MSVPSIEQLCERLEKVYEKDKLAAAAGVILCEEVPEAAKAMASDIPFEYERPQHYICDVEERRRLFAEIKPFFPFVVEANSTLLAIFMVCPLSELRSLADSLAEYDLSSDEGRLRYEYSPPYISLIYSLKDAIGAIAEFLAKPTKNTTPRTTPKNASPATTPKGVAQKRKREASEGQSGTPSPLHKRVLPANTEGGPAVRSVEPVSQEIPAASPSTPENAGIILASPTTRSRNAAIRAKARDGNVCLLTGTENPEAAHIYPFSAGLKRESTQIDHIATLASFWGQERADAWRSQFRSSRVTESPKNLLSLNNQIHFWWGAGRLALRPMQTLDPCTIKVQLHWLRRSARRPTMLSNGSLDDISALCGGGTDFESWGRPPVAHRKSGLPLETGQIFTIRADDPQDLPSFELLEMQWDLLRIAAMSGAAEAQDEGWAEDEEDFGGAGDVVLSDVPDADVEALDLYQTEENDSRTT